MFTKEMIKDYADKLLFELSDEQVDTLLEEFSVIKDNMDIIANISNIDKVNPLSFPQEIYIDRLRDDKEIHNIDSSDALKNSDDVIEDVISIPKVVG